MSRVLIDLTGRKVGRLTVIRRVGTVVRPNGCKVPTWLCQCSCGRTTEVNGISLRTATTRSCGCLASDTVIARSWKHGQSRRGAMTGERNIWNGMKQRCCNPNAERFDRYGGRGISVCASWMESFESFFADMGKRPSPRHTLERIDNDGHYEPGNCKWATRAEQRLNQNGRQTLVTVNGETLNVTQAAAKYGINRDRLRWRIEDGWPHHLAVDPNYRRPNPIKGVKQGPNPRKGRGKSRDPLGRFDGPA